MTGFWCSKPRLEPTHAFFRQSKVLVSCQEVWMGLGSTLYLARVGRPPRVPVTDTRRYSSHSGHEGQRGLHPLCAWPHGIAHCGLLAEGRAAALAWGRPRRLRHVARSSVQSRDEIDRTGLRLGFDGNPYGAAAGHPSLEARPLLSASVRREIEIIVVAAAQHASVERIQQILPTRCAHLAVALRLEAAAKFYKSCA